MAESSSIDTKAHNGHAELHSPRPRKPTRIDLLKPQLAEEVFNKDGTPKEPGSGVSRYSRHIPFTGVELTDVAGEPLQFLQTLLHPSKLPLLRAVKFALSRSSACFLASNS
jgi:hypothetical protein